MNAEISRLETIAKNSSYGEGINEQVIKYSVNVFHKHYNGGSILELGPAEGHATKELINIIHKDEIYSIVEGSSLFCEALRLKFPQIHIHNQLFETFYPISKYDNIIISQVLEHVSDPIQLLRLTSSWLKPNGIIFANVPNSMSIHRQAAVKMGLLINENDLNETDVKHGHRRVYNIDLLKTHFIKAGLCNLVTGGFWLKPLSNRQIEENWDKSMIDAFMILGEKYPDIAGEIYIIAKKIL